MAKEGDMSLFNDVLEPFRRVINTDPPKDKLSAGSKLNFSDSNQSLKEGLSNLLSMGKRKSSLGMSEACTPEKRLRTESNSTPASVPPSPWETKRLKIDLIAAKAQITKLESRINHQHTIRKEMQILFEEERTSLTEQHKRDERALSDMEDRLQVVRRREQELKDEYNEVLTEHKQNKANWDKEKGDLLKQIAELKDKLLEANVSSKDQLSEMKKDMDELLQALEGAQSEVEILKKEVTKQTSRAEQCITLKTQLEKQTFELQQVTNKLKVLEYERDSYKDWQQQAKTAQKRLSNMADLEKEVGRLRTTERTLRDAVCNKLLLEEQVHQLQSRVDSLQPVQQELHEAKVKIASLETSLEKYASVCRAAGAEGAEALAAALDSALNTQLSATAATSHAHSQLAHLTEDVATLKYERDKATGKLNDLMTVRKNQESLIHRLQKRLQLVTRERDSYRQQLDCYEKELTVTLSGESGAGNATLLAARVEQLEKSLQGYRDLLATHDSTAHAKLVESLRAESSKWREEAEAQRRDVAKLRAQRDALTAHLERIGSQAQTKVSLWRSAGESPRGEQQVARGGGGAEARRGQAARAEGRAHRTPRENRQPGADQVLESLRAESSKWREEAEAQRRDVAKLRAQRDALTAHLERIGSQAQTKVLHLADNPAAAAHKEMQQDLVSAQEEIKRLRAELDKSTSSGLRNSLSSEETQKLMAQLESSRIKLRRMKEEFTTASQEYRDVVYMLLGYKIDRTGHNNYKLSSMYAESPDDYLSFTLIDDGIEMVHTEYSTTLGELVDLHLHEHRSIPMFLSGLTQELFNRTTMQQEIN